MLADFTFPHHCPEGGAMTSPIFAGHSNLFGVFSHDTRNYSLQNIENALHFLHHAQG